MWGEQLRVVGDHAEVGQWDPQLGLVLDPTAWPQWQGELSVPDGTRIDLKLVITGEHGAVEWEMGDDRHVRAHGDDERVAVPLSFR